MCYMSRTYLWGRLNKRALLIVCRTVRTSLTRDLFAIAYGNLGKSPLWSLASHNTYIELFTSQLRPKAERKHCIRGCVLFLILHISQARPILRLFTLFPAPSLFFCASSSCDDIAVAFEVEQLGRQASDSFRTSGKHASRESRLRPSQPSRRASKLRERTKRPRIPQNVSTPQDSAQCEY